MKYARHLGAFAMVLLMLSCAQPPKAEVDAARAKVAAAQKDADILTYAPDALQQAKDALARMEKNLSDRKYPEAKSAALQAASLADGAKADVGPAKERAKTEAGTLVDEGKKQLAALLPTVSAATKAKPAGLDIAALDKDLAAARAKLADADSAFNAGNFAAARDLAGSAKASFSEIEKRVSDAIQKARKKK
jgi:predicted S18 family serine protease